MKYALFAWLLFIAGLGILGFADYYIRWRDGWLGHSGLPTPDIIWFGVPLLLGIFSVLLLWRSTAHVQRVRVRLAVVSVQAFGGFLLYMVLCLWYVISTGVDAP